MDPGICVRCMKCFKSISNHHCLRPRDQRKREYCTELKEPCEAVPRRYRAVARQSCIALATTTTRNGFVVLLANCRPIFDAASPKTTIFAFSGRSTEMSFGWLMSFGPVMIESLSPPARRMLRRSYFCIPFLPVDFPWEVWLLLSTSPQPHQCCILPVPRSFSILDQKLCLAQSGTLQCCTRD